MTTQSKMEDTEISITELHAFADDDYYVDKWIGLQQNKSKFVGFNAFAALFGPVWCFFRKLYVLGVVILFLELLLPMVFILSYEFITDSRIPNKPAFEMTGYLVTLLLTRLSLGLTANIVYFKKAVKVISKANAINATNEIYLDIIKSSGGINFPAILIPIAIYAGLKILSQA